jgi:hypothetical protein
MRAHMFTPNHLGDGMPVEIIVRRFALGGLQGLRPNALLRAQSQHLSSPASAILQCRDGRMVLPRQYAVRMPLPAAAIAGEISRFARKAPGHDVRHIHAVVNNFNLK